MSVKENPKGGLAERVAQFLGLKANQANLIKLLAVGLAVGILFLNAGELFGVAQRPSHPPGATEVGTPPSGNQTELGRLQQQMAQELESILSAIDGAGRVRVQLTLSAGPGTVPVVNTRVQENTTDEKAGDNSTRRTTTVTRDSTNVMTKDGTSESVAITKQTRAEIGGVLIVAEGAKDFRVRTRLFEATVTALRIPAHHISVIPGGR